MISFLIVAIAVFMLIKAINKLQKPAAAPTTEECPKCFSAIPIKATRCPTAHLN